MVLICEHIVTQNKQQYRYNIIKCNDQNIEETTENNACKFDG